MTPNHAETGTASVADAEARRVVNAEVELHSAERLAFFSDAVVAIAITLLALELPVPHGGSNSVVLHQLADNRDEYLSFLISFVVIGNHWTGHHRLFRNVCRLGGALMRFNILWLLMIVTTPFVTKLLTVPSGGFQVRFGLYAGVQVLAGLLFGLMAWQISHHDLLRPGTPRSAQVSAYRQAAVMVVIFGLSIPLAAVLGQWVFLIWLALPITMRVMSWVIPSAPEEGAG